MSLAIEFASTLLYSKMPFTCRNYLLLAQLCHTEGSVCVHLHAFETAALRVLIPGGKL